MIPKSNRFHGFNALNKIYKKGSGARNGPLAIKVLDSTKDDYRLAVVVSRKVHKSAVIRNRIRRRIFEVVRNLKKNQNEPWQKDIVITVFDENVAELPSAKVETYIKDLFKKANII